MAKKMRRSLGPVVGDMVSSKMFRAQIRAQKQNSPKKYVKLEQKPNCRKSSEVVSMSPDVRGLLQLWFFI